MKYFKALLLITLLFFGFSCTEKKPKNEADESFSFVFASDIHLQPEKNAPKGFARAIDSINALQPDFVITGGDLINDALAVSHGEADSLYRMYLDLEKRFEMPVYNAIGNHDLYGLYAKSGASSEHPDYGRKMFENRLSESYYTFEHKHTKFFVLNSVSEQKAGKYYGEIDSVQMVWIRNELENTDKNRPVFIVSHIPFITAYSQRYMGSTKANDSSLVTINSKEVLSLFEAHNLKAVLQGHLHIVEEIRSGGVRFITGGAVCGRWWTGPNRGYEEGFVKLEVSQDSFTWEYIDYGWKAE
jgi:3',5'-cyclic AMP phosphodiesterase CpdA